MKKDYMLELSAEELDEYARTLGIDASKVKGVKAKADLIEKRREKVAEIDTMGITVLVPVKKMHDKRITDRLNGKRMDDESFERLMRNLLGDEQMDAIEARCTDEDGTVDIDAIGIILSKIVHSDELKNF